MNLTERAAIVLQQIDAALTLPENATEELWELRQVDTDPQYTAGAWYHAGPAACKAKSDAIFIAASRTGWPMSLRCLKTTIKGLLTLLQLNCTDEILNISMTMAASEDTARVTLTTLCDQWETAQTKK